MRQYLLARYYFWKVYFDTHILHFLGLGVWIENKDMYSTINQLVDTIQKITVNQESIKLEVANVLYIRLFYEIHLVLFSVTMGNVI